MKKWEYKYVKLEKGRFSITSSNAGVDEKQLNELGLDCWEMVSIIQFNLGGTSLAAIFKREI